jgi:DNA-binding NarL/FixJ family response regulator
MVREMLLQTCASALPSANLAEAGDCAEARLRLRSAPPDLVVLDLELPDGDGLALVPELFAAAPSVRVIALSSHTDEFTLHRAQEARVHGFVDKKEQPLRVLGEAIAAVLDGKVYFSPLVQRLRATLRADPAAFNKLLSEREQEILGLCGLGHSNEEIGELLGLSSNTVKNHRRSIMAKLGLHGTPKLMRYAVEKGFTRVVAKAHRLG